MKKVISNTVFIITAALVVSCKKEYIFQSQLDKEIRIPFPIVQDGTFSTSFETLSETTFLKDFDKRDYTKVDSITFIVGLLSQNKFDTVYIRLYDATDNIVIDNSLLKGSTDLDSPTLVQTNNIFEALPNKKIDLAIQLKGNKDEFAMISLPYLKLRRD